MKKIASFLLCFIFMANLLSGASSLFVPEIKSYGLISQDGKIISFINNETTVKGYVDVVNVNSINSDNLGELVVECYVDGVLENTERTTIAIQKNISKMQVVTESLEVPQGDGNVMFKVFVLDPEGVKSPEVEIYPIGLEIPGAEQDGERYAEEIEIVKALEVMSSHEDGNFYPSEALTRAEFAVILTRLMGKVNTAERESDVLFDDVDSSHWAFGYINVVTKLDIMEGYDGSFRPEVKVDAIQALTSLVIALGYQPAVDSDDYFSEANEIGISEGTELYFDDDLVSRGTLAKLIVNSLDIPLMEQTGFGDYQEYIIQDGMGIDSPYKKSLLSENFSVARLRVNVVRNLGVDGVRRVGMAQIEVDRDYRSKFGSWDYYGDADFAVGRIVNVAAGDSGLLSMVGLQAMVYVKVDETVDANHIVLHAERLTSPYDTSDIAIDNIENIVEKGYGYNAYYEVEFYESADTARTTKITVASDARVYVNGHRDDYLTVEDIGHFYGTVSFAKVLTDTISIADYDTVFVNDYKIMIVDEVNTSAGRVTGEGQVYRIIFNPNDTAYFSKLIDVDGNELEWTSLKENDVLAVQEVRGSGVTLVTATLIEETVTGSVNLIDEDSDARKTEYGIGGNSYKININVFSDSLELGDEGIFYLDIMGRIVNFELEDVAARNYAYVMAFDPDIGGLDNVAQVRFYTAQGEIVTFDTASKLTFVDEDGTMHSGTDSSDIDEYIEVGDVVTFTLNSAGRINRITQPRSDATGTTSFRKYTEGTAGEYNYRTERFSITGGRSVYVDSSTVIMNVAEIDDYGHYSDDDFGLVSLTSVSSDIEIPRNIYAFDVNSSNIARVIVIVGDFDITSDRTNIAMVLNSETVENDYGNMVSKLSVYQDSKESSEIKTLLGNSDLGILPPFRLGDVIVPRINAKGVMSGYNEIATINEGQVVAGADHYQYENKVEYTLGTVVGKSGNRITIDNGYDFIVPTAANVYTYDERNQSVSVENIDCFDVLDNKFYKNGEVESIKALVCEYDGLVADIVLYFFGEVPAFSETDVNFCVTEEFAATSVTYYNNSDEEINPILVVAHYENGKLVRLSQLQTAIGANSHGVLNSALFSDFKNGDEVKAMLIKNFDTLEPLKVAAYAVVDNDYLNDNNAVSFETEKIYSVINSTVSYLNSNDEIEQLTLASNLNVYINGVVASNFHPSMLTQIYGSVAFSNINQNNQYRTISITEYTNIIVDYVNTTTKTLVSKNGERILYDSNSANTFAFLYDTEGNSLDWSVLNKNDILSTKIVESNDLKIYISTLAQDKISGKITEIDNNAIEIDGIWYDAHDPAIANELMVEDEGIFHLDVFGRVVMFVLEDNTAKTYAYVMAIASDIGGLDNAAEVRFYTSQGEIVTPKTTTRLNIEHERYDGTYGIDSIDADEIEEYVEVGDTVIFTLNSQNRINKITKPRTNSTTSGFNLYSSGVSGEYDYRNERFRIDGGRDVYVDAGTVIMNVGEIEFFNGRFYYDEDDFQLISLSGISNDVEIRYSYDNSNRIFAFDVNKSNVARAVVIVGPFDTTSDKTGIAMLLRSTVTSVANGERRGVATVFQDAIKNDFETVNLVASSDLGDNLDLKEADLFTASLNAAGQIRANGITRVATIDSYYGGAYLLEEGSGKVAYEMHNVISRTGARIEVEDETGREDVIAIPSRANVYTYNSSGNNSARRVLATPDRYNVFYSDRYGLYDMDNNALDSVQMFVRFYDGEVADVVFYLWYW